MNDIKYSPNTLEAAIAFLRDSEKIHLELLKYVIQCDEQAIYPADMVMHGVAQRSLMLISGFLSMVEQSNAICAGPLLRLQLDNVMRFYALWLVKDPGDVLMALLSDNFRKLKSQGGIPLTDSFLCNEIAKNHPGFKKVYKKTSGFVHLSTPGIFSSIIAVGTDENRKVYFNVGSGAGRKWKTEEKKEAVDAFIAATDILLHLFSSWGNTKEEVAKQRQ